MNATSSNRSSNPLTRTYTASGTRHAAIHESSVNIRYHVVPESRKNRRITLTFYRPHQRRLGIGYPESVTFVVPLRNAARQRQRARQIASGVHRRAQALLDERRLQSLAAKGRQRAVGKHGSQAAIRGHGASSRGNIALKCEIRTRSGHVP